MCPLCPGQSRDHFAMNVAIMLLRWASIFVKVLNSAALSADASALSNVIAASMTPGPGLLVQALDAEVHRLARREQLAIELGAR